MSTTHTTGKLLVATPQIEEGVFRRSVVLVLHHDDDGAQGLVLNRPIDADVDAVLPGWEEHATRPAKVFQGGPVQLDSALGLVAVPGDSPEPTGVRRLFGAVALVDLDPPPTLVVPEVAGLRIFAGYAGWSAGQLEDEVVERDVARWREEVEPVERRRRYPVDETRCCPHLAAGGHGDAVVRLEHVEVVDGVPESVDVLRDGHAAGLERERERRASLTVAVRGLQPELGVRLADGCVVREAGDVLDGQPHCCCCASWIAIADAGRARLEKKAFVNASPAR